MANDEHGKLAARCNRGFKRMESVISVKQLKERYLFGIEIVDKNGNELPNSVFQNYIDNAISWLEHDLDISITPTQKEEQKDYQAYDYFQWGYFYLNEVPVISIESIKISYLRNNSGVDLEDLDIPSEWWRLDPDTGLVRLVPNNKFPARLQVGSGGGFFPELFRRHGHVPALWVFQYTHGFKDGKVPTLMNSVIGLLASIQALSIAGNLVLEAGIAGTSISLDGLSESIQTTQSAENSAYSATRKEYADQVFGRRAGDPNALIGILRNYYKGQTMSII